MKLKHLTLDNKGRVMVSRLVDGHKMAVTAFNYNTRTLQVGGSKTDYPTLLKILGEDATKELIDYLVLCLCEFGGSV